MRLTKILIILSLVFVTSCANFNSIHRKTEINETSSAVSVDAKQRFLISSTVVESTTDLSGVTKEKLYPVVCAEPSPDAFSVYSAAIEADASKADQLTAALKAATSESGATIGIRSEAIQLLRDAMFRLCEAYASGGLTSVEYSKMVGKYQKSMVTLIAISQLTGASVPAQLVLSNNSSIELSNKTFEAKEQLDKTRSELSKQQGKDTKLAESVQQSKNDLGNYSEKCPNEKAIDGVEQADCDAHKELLQNKKDSEAELARLEKDVAEWSSVFDSANKATSLSTQAVSKAIESSSGQIDKDTIVALSGTVKGLVTEVFLDDLISTCVEGMASLALTGADEIERNKSLSATLEGSNKLQAQTIFLSTCEQVISRKLAGK
ncbi:hypothetical protein [Thalassomonas actiniarum]|uniref:Lipoprotein n=1 Tax=Thalassomonas actiniarum TaxID=485447 RepID=A0AAE9YUW4_9GAMM|nr:hypothetical protein [Thalassomonas actiniarum]WDE01012.1 hypothetical protein SG35_010470 [Thalassomonas actiniarum]